MVRSLVATGVAERRFCGGERGVSPTVEHGGVLDSVPVHRNTIEATHEFS